MGAELLLEMAKTVEDTGNRRRRSVTDEVTWEQLESLLEELESAGRSVLDGTAKRNATKAMMSSLLKDWNLDIMELIQMDVDDNEDGGVDKTVIRTPAEKKTPRRSAPSDLNEMTLRLLRGLGRMLEHFESEHHALTLKLYDRKIQWAEEETKYQQLQEEQWLSRDIEQLQTSNSLSQKNRQLRVELNESNDEMIRLLDLNRVLKEQLRDTGVVDLISPPIPLEPDDMNENNTVRKRRSALATIVEGFNRASRTFEQNLSYEYSDDGESECFVACLMDDML